jgi:hypothetical protein
VPPSLVVVYSGLPAGQVPFLSDESEMIPASPCWTDIRDQPAEYVFIMIMGNLRAGARAAHIVHRLEEHRIGIGFETERRASDAVRSADRQLLVYPAMLGKHHIGAAILGRSDDVSRTFETLEILHPARGLSTGPYALRGAASREFQRC